MTDAAGIATLRWVGLRLTHPYALPRMRRMGIACQQWPDANRGHPCIALGRRYAGPNLRAAAGGAPSKGAAMRTMNVLVMQRTSAAERARIEAVDQTIRVTDAGGWFDGRSGRRGRVHHGALSWAQRQRPWHARGA